MFGSLFGGGKKKSQTLPPTQRQLDFAEKLGIRGAASMDRDSLSEKIDKKLEARKRSGKAYYEVLEGRIDELESQLGSNGKKRAAKKKK